MHSISVGRVEFLGCLSCKKAGNQKGRKVGQVSVARDVLGFSATVGLAPVRPIAAVWAETWIRDSGSAWAVDLIVSWPGNLPTSESADAERCPLAQALPPRARVFETSSPLLEHPEVSGFQLNRSVTSP